MLPMLFRRQCRPCPATGSPRSRQGCHRQAPICRPRRGLTLVEMLIAMAITLLMMAGVVNLFANMSAGVRDRRAMIELGGQLRAAREQLNRDLAGATCPAITWQKPGENVGYIEIIEGVRNDFDPTTLTLDSTTLVPSSQITTDASGNALPPDGLGLGDFDDILALTVRSSGEPFVGQKPNGDKIESELAEVIWFAVEEDGTNAGEEAGMRRIYRRTLLIAPWVNISLADSADPEAYYLLSDISAHWVADTSAPNGVGYWKPNTLGDLTKRENRCYRYPLSVYPHPMYYPQYLAGARLGQDLMLNDALAFDVRVYDPGAPLFEKSGAVLQPGDRGWNFGSNSGLTPVSYGAFVDLKWNGQWQGMRLDPSGTLTFQQSWASAANEPRTLFAGVPDFRSLLDYSTSTAPSQPTTTNGTSVIWPAVVYDTWSEHYEKDGIDQDNDGLVDEGTNGFDDLEIDPNNPTGPRIIANGVDDVAERETSPPYDVPLRGIQVKLRVYEREARQVREATVVRSFVP